MAVVSVTKTWSSRDGQGTWDARGIAEEYDVLTDSVSDNAFVAGTAIDPNTGLRVPNQGDPLDGDTYCRVKGKYPKPVGPMHWLVRVEYESLFPQLGSTVGQSDDPTEFPPEFEWDWIGGTEEVDKDANGAALRTTAGDPLHGIKIEVQDLVLRVTRNEPTFNALRARQYVSKPTVNSDVFLGCDPGTVLCGPIRARYTRWRGFEFWRVSYEFVYREDGWDRRVLAQGMNCYVTEGETTKKVPVKTQVGGNKESSEPQRLSLQGFQLDDDDPDEFQELDLTKDLPFSVFNIEVPQ